MTVRFVWRSSDGDKDLDVMLPPGATIGDLVAALAGKTDLPIVHVDGVPQLSGQRASETNLTNGSVVSVEGPDLPSSLSWVAELSAIGGPSAGGRWLLGPGLYRIGSDPGCEIRIPDPTVDQHHADLTIGAAASYCKARHASVLAVNHVTGRDRIKLEYGSLLQLGQTVWEFNSPPSESRFNEPTTGVFNRPPRIQPSFESARIDVPQRPAEPTPQGRPGWATLLVPLAMGALFAVLFSPMMATFALLGPMMMLAAWFEDRRRVKKARRVNATEFGNALVKFEQDLRTAGSDHVGRQRSSLIEPPEVVRRALAVHPRLWERRPDHMDFMKVGLGAGSVSWSPNLVGEVGDEDTSAVLSRHARLKHAPIGVELRSGLVLGIAGGRKRTMPLARWLVTQVGVHQGPADVRVAVITDQPGDWDWTKWLPHTDADSTSDRRLLATIPEDIDEVLAYLGTSPSPEGSASPLNLLISDIEALDPARRNRLRSVQAGSGLPVTGIVVSPSLVSLPGLCNAVIEMPDDLRPATCRFPANGTVVSDLLPTGLPTSIALECARSLARLQDPEIAAGTVDLPDLVPLADLLDPACSTAQGIIDRWESAGPVPQIAGPVGISERGPLTIDLVADGPHGLIAGTTGSGKSELLRSLIVSLAAAVSPDHLNFALIDYKGGSAFDACARLPHVVGVVTDLDAHLGRRALTCLEAELRYREARLREAEATDLPEYLATTPEEPLPRLVVVIDEFAAMAAELPGFVPSLVDIAQRGRSLGVHLLLATQRPAGVIGENIRANTNLRIALRVHNAADSRDVLDDQAAATIPRGRAGRGFVRLGPSELVPFQAALVSTSNPLGGAVPVGLRPFRFGWEPQPGLAGSDQVDNLTTDLDRLVDTISAAARSAGIRVPRSPWPPELPVHLPFRRMIGEPGRGGLWWTGMGLVDEPHRQRRAVWGWDGSNLLAYGMPGSGPARALLALGVSLAERYQPDQIHIYALDFGTRTLASLRELPHVGGVIGSADRERQIRLLRYLQEEVEARRTDDPEERPAVVLLLDNYGGFSAAFDHPSDLGYRETLRRIVADGPGVGVFVAISADQAAAVPTNLAALIPEKLVFRMADLFDYATLGLPNRDLPDLPNGRAIEIGGGLVLQIADIAPEDVSWVAARSMSRGVEPTAIGVLPQRSDLAEVASRASITGPDWFLPIGIGERRLEPVGLHLGESEHALIAGPAKSGKSTALLAVSILVGQHRPDVLITALAPRRSPLRESADIDTLITDFDDMDLAVQTILDDSTPQLILIDDADDLDDPGGALLRLFRERRPDIRVVGAGRADTLRSMYGHWTKELRRNRHGVALRPQADIDGELWHTTLPRHGPPLRMPGRGYLIGEEGIELIQVAHP